MKRFKILGLAALVTGALTATVCVASASATKFCTTPNCSSDLAAGSTISASLTGGSAILESTSGTLLDTCTGATMAWTTAQTSAAEITGNISSLTWSGCTRTTHTLNKGSVGVEYSSGDEGSAVFENSEVTVLTPFGSCVYDLFFAVLNGGNPAKLEMKSTALLTSGLCPHEALWTMTYNVTSPSSLYVAP